MNCHILCLKVLFVIMFHYAKRFGGKGGKSGLKWLSHQSGFIQWLLGDQLYKNKLKLPVSEKTSHIKGQINMIPMKLATT